MSQNSIRVLSERDFDHTNTTCIHAKESIFIPVNEIGITIKTGITILEAPNNSPFNGCTIGGFNINGDVNINQFVIDSAETYRTHDSCIVC